MNPSNSKASHFRCFLSFNAPIAKVYEAIATPAGLRSWWTKTADVGIAVGETSTFRFGETHNTMRIEKLVPNEEVRWKCLAQHHHAPGKLSKTDEWAGTSVVFHLSENTSGGTDLHFEHIGLTPELECFDICNKGWKHHLGTSLKGLVETGVGQPFTA